MIVDCCSSTFTDERFGHFWLRHHRHSRLIRGRPRRLHRPQQRPVRHLLGRLRIHCAVCIATREGDGKKTERTILKIKCDKCEKTTNVWDRVREKQTQMKENECNCVWKVSVFVCFRERERKRKNQTVRQTKKKDRKTSSITIFFYMYYFILKVPWER